MRALVLAALLSLVVGVASAGAATRYAAPGGTGADPCANPEDPCTIYLAADGGAPGTTVTSGDVVMLAPGTYSDVSGDLGPVQRVQPAPNVRIQGEAGKPRPVIRLESNEGGFGAFFVGGGASISDIQIDNVAAGVFPHNAPAFSVEAGGVAERILARTTEAPAITCTMLSGGIIRNTVCLNEAPNGTALGASSAAGGGLHTMTLRNVTALATGSASLGVWFAFFTNEPGNVFNVGASSVIARGQAFDVRASGLRLSSTTGTGATTNITLDHSDFTTADTQTSGGGSASVTTPGTGTNITDAPLFAADGYHQLPTSPTVDKGAVDGSSGTVDLDGQLRTIGSAPDIGADELAHATSTSVACSPQTLVSGAAAPNCSVTVTDTAPGATAPTGNVTSGGMQSGSFCTLVPISAVASSCAGFVSVGPGFGIRPVSVQYQGDPTHDPSSGGTAITVVAPQPGGGGSGGGGGGGSSGAGGASGGSASGASGSGAGGGDAPRVAPATVLGKHPPKRTPKRLAKFTFTSDQTGAGFECRLDKGKFKPCGSPAKRKVGLGAHTFRVRAVGSSGLTDTTPVAFSWTRTG